MRPRRQAPRAPCIERSRLLQLVVEADEPVGVRELARRAGLSRSTTSRTLGILTELGMVERTSDGAARPGAGLATLTERLDGSPAVLRERFRPLAVEMRRTYSENAAVGIDDGIRVPLRGAAHECPPPCRSPIRWIARTRSTSLRRDWWRWRHGRDDRLDQYLSEHAGSRHAELGHRAVPDSETAGSHPSRRICVDRPGTRPRGQRARGADRRQCGHDDRGGDVVRPVLPVRRATQPGARQPVRDVSSRERTAVVSS